MSGKTVNSAKLCKIPFRQRTMPYCGWLTYIELSMFFIYIYKWCNDKKTPATFQVHARQPQRFEKMFGYEIHDSIVVYVSPTESILFAIRKNRISKQQEKKTVRHYDNATNLVRSLRCRCHAACFAVLGDEDAFKGNKKNCCWQQMNANHF